MATDSTLNVFVGYGTAAARAAFTPAPPTPGAGFSPLYVYYETDTNLVWHYTTAWHCISKPEGAFALQGDISPSQITADQNDYNPTGLSTASTLRLSTDASRNVTGLQGGADGRILFVHNVGSFNIVLKDESASSTAANRFALTADVTLSADSVAILQYDSTSSRWRCLSAGSGGGSFTTASPTEVLTGTDTSKGVTPDSLAALWEQGSDVASAGTVSLGEGGYFNITGTTTITDIDFATDKAGRKAWVKFAGALTLTHNASTLILPTGANITTAAGDTACFISEGSDVVRCVAYNRASGAALSGGTALTAIYEDQKAANTAGGGSTAGSWQTRTLNTEVYDDIGITLSSNQLSLPAGTYEVDATTQLYRTDRRRARLQDVTGTTVTLTIASPCVVSWAAHGLPAGTPITFSTTGALPTGLTPGTIYYVLSPNANDFNVAATPGGAAINTSGSQSGVHTAFVTLAMSDTQYGVSTTSGDQSAPRVQGRFTINATTSVELQYRVETAQASNGLGVQSNFGLTEVYSRVKLTKLS